MVAAALQGVLPVIATPFDSEFKIDFAVLGAEVDWLLGNGADGVVVAMVSEIQRLSTAERQRLNDATCALVNGRGPVVVSVGAESTAMAVELAREARSSGATAVMAAPPLLTSIDENGLRSYLDAIMGAAEMPVILQDASAYVGNAIDPRLQAKLVDEYGAENLFLKPEATPIGPMVTAIHEAGASDVRIFDGSGGLALVDTYARGIAGTMPGPDLVWALRALWDALEAGDRQRSIAISSPLAMLQSMVPGLDAYVAFEKYLLVRQGVLPSARVRGPVGFVLDGVERCLADALFDEIARVVDLETVDSSSRPKAFFSESLDKTPSI
jgi:dihydrodipicolinate synthase/N-acetylneuraminate lyase